MGVWQKLLFFLKKLIISDFDVKGGDSLVVWEDIRRQGKQQSTYGELEPSQLPAGFQREPIIPNNAYVDVFLRSMHVVNVRKNLDKFYGIVHSYISLPYLYKENAQFHVLTTPVNLRGIDPTNIDKTIQLNHQLMDSVPYRGGDLKIELSLFSIECNDLAISFVKFLEKQRVPPV